MAAKTEIQYRIPPREFAFNLDGKIYTNLGDVIRDFEMMDCHATYMLKDKANPNPKTDAGPRIIYKSAAWRKSYGKSKKNESRPPRCSINGVKYLTYREAAGSVGVDHFKVSERCRSTHSDWVEWIKY